MTAIHRTSYEVTRGEPIDGRPDYIRRSADAETGSDQLLNAMREQFFRLAVKKSIPLDDAAKLLMNGVEPR